MPLNTSFKLKTTKEYYPSKNYPRKLKAIPQWYILAKPSLTAAYFGRKELAEKFLKQLNERAK